ncbi:MAG TPA: oxidoreductase [Acidimicrobiales bacterium]|nr:oxidoreductase [Acidimicrobiales bacterium]
MHASDAGTWRLGGRTVNRVGFGAMRLTGSAAFHLGVPSDRNLAIATLREAVRLGVNHVDTAAFYFSATRSANELINAALSPYSDDLVIVTKVGPGRDPSGEWQAFARPDQLRGQVEENLRQLGRDHLDVVNLRVLDSQPLAEHLGVLADLVGEGLIGHLGVSGVTKDQLDEARHITQIVCVQNRYSVEARTADADAVLEACGEAGIAFVPFFSLAGSGTAHGRSAREHDVVLALARAHGATPPQVRLAWTLARGEHVLVIPGTGNPAHVAENVAAGSLRLREEELARLDSLVTTA